MFSWLKLGDLRIEVTFKNIKHVHLSVYPPAGTVRIAAPQHMKLDTVRLFAIAKLDWIRQQQEKLRLQEREAPREYLDRESHYVWGRRYLLKLVEKDASPRVELKPRTLLMHVRPGMTTAHKRDILDAWYRDQIRLAVPPLVEHWESILNVKAGRCYVQRMKTRWGSCNPVKRNIRLNTELAKKPSQCLEYVLVHELLHLVEPSHNARFVELMNRFLPDWKARRDMLNQLPVRHENWDY